MQCVGDSPKLNQPLNNFVCTIGVKDYDATEAMILSHRGKNYMPKTFLLGMA